MGTYKNNVVVVIKIDAYFVQLNFTVLL